ncbi:MAG: hypothetical protein A4E32_02109 [Methanomassiliicoccales archaeon PtaU1.Bin124]|nr:MAG: hypothetical protein A4E32_02109 [Methanomassiliicoccales archaeon PtaU1.Bin124]
MLIPMNITSQHVVSALNWIDKGGIPLDRRSRQWDLLYDGKRYPPKYVISVANRYANRHELSPDEFTIHQARPYLKRLGFKIVPKR